MANLPLDKLHVELIREPTPSISMSGSWRQDKYKSKSKRESPEMSRRSEIDHNKSEGSVREAAQSKENPEQQALSPTQVEIPALPHPANKAIKNKAGERVGKL